MIVLDANILLYAYDSTAVLHVPARRWVERTLSGTEPVWLPWQTLGAWVRIATNQNLPGSRYTVEEAVEIVNGWLDQPHVRLLAPTEQHWPWFREMLLSGQARGPLATDAQLAALTLAYGGVLHTTDRDFSRFPGLRWVNPLLDE